MHVFNSLYKVGLTKDKINLLRLLDLDVLNLQGALSFQEQGNFNILPNMKILKINAYYKKASPQGRQSSNQKETCSRLDSVLF